MVIYLFVIDFECLFWNGCLFIFGGVIGILLIMSCGWGMIFIRISIYSGFIFGYLILGLIKYIVLLSLILWRYIISLSVECKIKCYRILIIDYSVCIVFNK